MAEITPLLRTSGHTCQGKGLRPAHSGSHCAHFIAVAPLMKTTLGDAQHKSQHWMSGNRPRSAQEKAGVQCMGRASSSAIAVALYVLLSVAPVAFVELLPLVVL